MNSSSQGIHAHRLNDHNPREVAFTEQWVDENENRDLVWSLLSQECQPDDDGAVRVWGSFTGSMFRKFPLGDVTDRDRTVVATMMQWLGTNVGFCYVEQALDRCGYDIVRRSSEGRAR